MQAPQACAYLTWLATLQELEEFVAACLARKAEDRPSAAALLKHPLLKHVSRHSDEVSLCG